MVMVAVWFVGFMTRLITGESLLKVRGEGRGLTEVLPRILWLKARLHTNPPPR